MADLKEGDPVYCWDGAKRPEHPTTGRFLRRMADGRYVIEDVSSGFPIPWQHAESVFKHEDWRDDEGNKIQTGDLVDVWDVTKRADRCTLLSKNKIGYLVKAPLGVTASFWKHAKKVQVIPKGTLVAAWNGNKEPERPKIIYYERETQCKKHIVSDPSTGVKVFSTRDNVRPVTSDDLKKWRGEDD